MPLLTLFTPGSSVIIFVVRVVIAAGGGLGWVILARHALRVRMVPTASPKRVEKHDRASEYEEEAVHTSPMS